MMGQGSNPEEQQFTHLMRLAWDLRKLGLRTMVDLPPRTEPVLVIPRAAGALKVMAVHRKGAWVFTWGRGRDQGVRALVDGAADRIWEVAQ
jgi:hypothetical protein